MASKESNELHEFLKNALFKQHELHGVSSVKGYIKKNPIGPFHDQKLRNVLDNIYDWSLSSEKTEESMKNVISEANSALMAHGQTNLFKRNEPKKISNIVLDLDETLVYVSKDIDNPEFKINYNESDIGGLVRPYLKDFLKEMEEIANLYIWSSGSKEYIASVAQAVDITSYFHRFYGRSKYNISQYEDLERTHKKKLGKAGFDLSKTLLIDNTPNKFRKNYGNGIQIKTWRGDPSDIELKKLSMYLKSIINKPDYRTIEKRGWEKKYNIL